MAEYPTLRVDTLSLRNRFESIRQQAKHQSVKSRYGELARIAYYLRDPKAPYYLQKAAEQETTSQWQASRLNLYRMAGDWTTMQTIYQQLLQQAATAERKQYGYYQAQIFEALFWLGNDQACIQQYQQHTPTDSVQWADILVQLAEARLNSNSQQALVIAQGLATTIRAERLEPWIGSLINLWDLYELACQQLDPPLVIDGLITTASNDPDLRLLALLNEQQIIALEWSIFNNNDEADEGYCIYHLADGTSKPLSAGFANQELERLVWDVVNFDWSSQFSDQQPYGIYRLDVQQAQVMYLGLAYSIYEYEDLQAYAHHEPNAIPYPVVQHPANPELYVMYLPEELRQAVDLARWNGEQRSY